MTAAATGDVPQRLRRAGRPDQAGRGRRTSRSPPARSRQAASSRPRRAAPGCCSRSTRQVTNTSTSRARGPALPGAARPDQGPRRVAGQPAPVRRMRDTMSSTEGRATGSGAPAPAAASPAGGRGPPALRRTSASSRCPTARHDPRPIPAAGPTTTRAPGRAPRPEPEVLSSVDTPPEPTPSRSASRATDTQPAGVRRRRPPLVPALLATCLAAVLAACVLAGVTTRRDRADAPAGSAAMAAARSECRHDPELRLPASGRRLRRGERADHRVVPDRLPGDRRPRRCASSPPRPRPSSWPRSPRAGVVSSTADRATVLLFVDQTTTSNRLEAAKVDQVRVQLTMTKVGGRWLVSGAQGPADAPPVTPCFARGAREPPER